MDGWTVALIVIWSCWGLASFAMLVYLIVPEKGTRRIPLFNRGEDSLGRHIGLMIIFIVGAPFFWTVMAFDARKNRKKAAK